MNIPFQGVHASDEMYKVRFYNDENVMVPRKNIVRCDFDAYANALERMGKSLTPNNYKLLSRWTDDDDDVVDYDADDDDDDDI